MEATAAGGVAAAGGGHPTFVVDPTGEEVIAGTPGPETTGVTPDTVDPLPGTPGEPEPPLVEPEPVIGTVTLGDVTVDEGSGTATITATLDNNVTGSDLVLTLDNGETITIPIGSNTGTSTPFAVQGDDPYLDGETYDVAISSASGGEFDDLNITDTAQVTIDDTIDTTTVTLTATPQTVEGSEGITYTATLANAYDGPPTADMTVVLSNEAEITIAAGSMSGSTTVPVQGDDPYWDGAPVEANIVSVGGGAEFENLVVDDSSVVTAVNDTIDDTTVSITGPANLVEGDETPGEYTVTLSNDYDAPPQSNVIVNFVYEGVALNGEDFSGQANVVIPAESMSATFDIATIPDDIQEGAESFTITIDSVSGGNYENLVIGTANSVETTIVEPLDTPDTVEESDMDLTQDAGELAASSVTGTTPDEPGESVINQSLNLQTGWDAVASSGTTSLGAYQINANGTYTYTLLNPANHSSGPVTDVIPYTATDGNGVEITNTLTITVENDIPVIGDPVDAFLTNAPGQLIEDVDLDIDFGADGAYAGSDPLIQPIQLEGPTAEGEPYAVDNTGAYLTSEGTKLVYLDDNSGGLIAVKAGDATEQPIFTVSVNPEGTYDVKIFGILDGAPEPFQIPLSAAPGTGGNELFFDIYTDVDDPPDGTPDVLIHATGQHGSGLADNVNYKSGGMGVGHAAKINWDDDGTSETLTLEFFEAGDGTTPLQLSSVEVGAGGFASNQTAYWTAYNDSDLKVGEGSFNDSTLTGGANDVFFTATANLADPGTTFSYIKLAAGVDGNGYDLTTLSLVELSEGIDHIVTYHVTATDGDLDTTSDPLDTFDVTFEGDGSELNMLVPEPVEDGEA
jgi:VCBS repeat-containing protein